jgi:integrase
MKMGRPHTIPLTPPVIKLIEVIAGFSSGREYLFPGYRNPRSHMNSSTVNMALKRMGYEGRLVAHGLRSLASTTLNEKGFNPDVIEAALAHKDTNSIRAAYNRAEYLEKRRVMLEWWSEHIESAATGSLSVANTNVVKLR